MASLLEEQVGGIGTEITCRITATLVNCALHFLCEGAVRREISECLRSRSLIFVHVFNVAVPSLYSNYLITSNYLSVSVKSSRVGIFMIAFATQDSF